MPDEMLLPISVGDLAERVRAHYALTPTNAIAGADGLPCYEVGERIAFSIDPLDRVGRIHVCGAAIRELGLDQPLSALMGRFAPLLRVWSLDEATAHLFASTSHGRIRFDIDAATQRPRDVFLFGGDISAPRQLPIAVGMSIEQVQQRYELAFDPVPDPDPALGSTFELPSEGLVIRFGKNKRITTIRISWGVIDGVGVSDTIQRVRQLKGTPTREWSNMENSSLLYNSENHGRVRFDVNDESLRVVSIHLLGEHQVTRPLGAEAMAIVEAVAASRDPGSATLYDPRSEFASSVTLDSAPVAPMMPDPPPPRAAPLKGHVKALAELRDTLQWSARWVDSAVRTLSRWPSTSDVDAERTDIKDLKSLLDVDIGEELPRLEQRRAAIDWLRDRQQRLERWRTASLLAAALDVASEPLAQTMRLSHLAFGASWPALMEAQMMQEKARRVGRLHEEVLYQLALTSGFIQALKSVEVLAHDVAGGSQEPSRALTFEAFLLAQGCVLHPGALPALSLRVDEAPAHEPDRTLFLEYCVRETSALLEVLKGRQLACSGATRSLKEQISRTQSKREEWLQWHALALRAKDRERAHSAQENADTHTRALTRLESQKDVFARSEAVLGEAIHALSETHKRARAYL